MIVTPAIWRNGEALADPSFCRSLQSEKIIFADIVFSEVDFSGFDFCEKINFENCTFEGDLYFDTITGHAYFQKGFCFEKCTFNANVVLDSVVSDGQGGFFGCQFNNVSNNSDVALSLDEATIKETLTFFFCYFKSGMLLDQLTVEKNLVITACRFMTSGAFSAELMHISGQLLIFGCIFNGNAFSISNTTVDGPIEIIPYRSRFLLIDFLSDNYPSLPVSSPETDQSVMDEYLIASRDLRNNYQTEQKDEYYRNFCDVVGKIWMKAVYYDNGIKHTVIVDKNTVFIFKKTSDGKNKLLERWICPVLELSVEDNPNITLYESILLQRLYQGHQLTVVQERVYDDSKAMVFFDESKGIILYSKSYPQKRTIISLDEMKEVAFKQETAEFFEEYPEIVKSFAADIVLKYNDFCAFTIDIPSHFYVSGSVNMSRIKGLSFFASHFMVTASAFFMQSSSYSQEAIITDANINLSNNHFSLYGLKANQLRLINLTFGGNDSRSVNDKRIDSRFTIEHLGVDLSRLDIIGKLTINNIVFPEHNSHYQTVSLNDSSIGKLVIKAFTSEGLTPLGEIDLSNVTAGRVYDLFKENKMKYCTRGLVFNDYVFTDPTEESNADISGNLEKYRNESSFSTPVVRYLIDNINSRVTHGEADFFRSIEALLKTHNLVNCFNTVWRERNRHRIRIESPNTYQIRIAFNDMFTDYGLSPARLIGWLVFLILVFDSISVLHFGLPIDYSIANGLIEFIPIQFNEPIVKTIHGGYSSLNSFGYSVLVIVYRILGYILLTLLIAHFSSLYQKKNS